MTAAIYVRVSSDTQDTKSQEAELKKWERDRGERASWFQETFTGTRMKRPEMERLLAAVRRGEVSRVVVWRLDRLGRTAKGLHDLLSELTERNVGFVSLRDSLDLGTSAGRLMFGVLASVAQYETEVRGERQRAGIARAREQNGGRCWWGGRRPGTRVKATRDKEKAIVTMRGQGQSIASIARAVGVTRKTIYAVLRRASE